jgi:UDP-N-acetylmuramoyl-L-alanyl-D-glutamate--2,6-diaminopimelate ligase
MHVCPESICTVSLAQVLPESRLFGIDDLQVDRVVCDSRLVRSGDLFAALPGSDHNGADFVADAIKSGAIAVLSQRPLPDAAVPVCLVSNVREAYGRLCQAIYGNPSKKLKVIGITGTNGKTTTACLIGRMFAQNGGRVGMLGTLGYFDGKECDDSVWTTPPADVAARYLARMVENECTHAVVELSSHALDQYRLAGVELEALCVTNICRDHLDYHHSIENYRQAKTRAFDYISSGGFSVVNADDLVIADYLDQVEMPTLTVGIDQAAELQATVIERQTSEQTFLLTAGNDTVPVRTRMIGLHHVYNCLEAAAVGLASGLPLVDVVRSLESVEYVPGRLQRIECGQPFSVFVDFAHTPDALAGVLQSLREVIDGRIICVVGAGGDRDWEKRPLLGHVAESGADQVILTSDNPRSEDPTAIINDLLEGFDNPEKVMTIVDRPDAIGRALAMADVGDCVLLAGKGHEAFQYIGDRQIPMDDYELASQWLYANLPAEI